MLAMSLQMLEDRVTRVGCICCQFASTLVSVLAVQWSGEWLMGRSACRELAQIVRGGMACR
ncbi:hypothetical protein BC835DRAFT_1344874 [Cytidiella melzeri]|nr:hypothetical protein BC835DRAFT_1392825 [Cytidiella melzeri]KAI0695802.1 hypothetical protein BC835DRAFT_1344874 [Cytidiella melzeri]